MERAPTHLEYAMRLCTAEILTETWIRRD